MSAADSPTPAFDLAAAAPGELIQADTTLGAWFITRVHGSPEPTDETVQGVFVYPANAQLERLYGSPVHTLIDRYLRPQAQPLLRNVAKHTIPMGEIVRVTHNGVVIFSSNAPGEPSPS